MDPEELTDEELDEIERRGAHVTRLDPTEIVGEIGDEGTKASARAEHEAIRARREAEEASAGGLGAVADALSRLPETIDELDLYLPAERALLSAWLGSGDAPTAGFTEGATLGFGDELTGAAAALSSGERGAYERARDDVRARSASARDASPIAYGAGTLAGGAASALALPGGAAGLGSRAARIAGALGEGALFGGAAGVGSSEGDLTTDEGRARLLDDAMEGVLAGGVAGGLGAGAGEAVSGLGGALRGYGRSADRARVAATIAGPGTPLSTTAERRLEGLPGGLAGVAERIRRPRTDAAGDFRIASTFGTGDDALAALERARETAGTTAGRFNDAVDAALPSGVPVADYDAAIARALEEYAPDAAIGRGSSRRVVERMGRDVAGSASGGAVPNPLLRDYLNRANERASRVTRGTASDAAERAGAMRSGARALRSAYDDAAERALPGIREPYRDARHDYATVEMLREYAEDAARRRARSGPGLTATLAASGERARGGSIPSVLAARELVGSARARLPALEATARETARSVAPAVESVRGPRGGLSAAAMERMLDEYRRSRSGEPAPDAAPPRRPADLFDEPAPRRRPADLFEEE